MIQVENIETMNFAAAIRGMRNPMNSWAKSDSEENVGRCDYCIYRGDSRCNDRAFCPVTFAAGPADLGLMRRLVAAGPEHRKFMRQIFVSMDITAPLYWWKEFDTYKVGTTANSCSTMHKLTAKRFTLEDFSTDHIEPEYTHVITTVIAALNEMRDEYLKTNDKGLWYTMVQLLPSSYNQRRTVTMTYENAFNIIQQRSGHKLQEWLDFVNVLLGLPYMGDLVTAQKSS